MAKTGPKPRPIAERFWPKVRKSDRCWEWTGTTNKAGYGYFWINELQKKDGAHRVSYRMHFGEIPDGMAICHRCDNPSCVRPDHLFLDDHEGNMADMWAKGRDRIWNHRLKRCQRGHDDWKRRRDGYRFCATCKRIRDNHRGDFSAAA